MHTTIVASIFLGLTASVFASPAAPPGQKVSTNAQCGTISGVQYTCQGSTFGNCCSSSGWCGSFASYCGTGCQGTFGSCTGSTTAKPTTTSSTKPTTTSSVTSSTAATTTAVDPNTIPNGRPYQTCGPEANNLVYNPSFESGSDYWVLSGGASVQWNSQDPYSQLRATDGKHFMVLESSAAKPNSTIMQNIPRFPKDNSNNIASFDYCYSYDSPDLARGTCTLSATITTPDDQGNPYVISIGSFTRGNMGNYCGSQRVSYTNSDLNGDLKFSWSCDPVPTDNGGKNWGKFYLALDNVKIQYCSLPN